MITPIKEQDFEQVYNDTYSKTLRFTIIKCNNIDDINDILQDTYIELLKIIKKKKSMDTDNLDAYIIGIANNVIKRHYHKKKKENVLSFYSNKEEENDLDLTDSFDLEQNIITKENVRVVWEYVKSKDLITSKIFYLYFALGLKISEVSKELELSESNVKNRIYRTLKELKKYLGKEVDGND